MKKKKKITTKSWRSERRKGVKIVFNFFFRISFVNFRPVFCLSSIANDGVWWVCVCMYFIFGRTWAYEVFSYGNLGNRSTLKSLDCKWPGCTSQRIHNLVPARSNHIPSKNSELRQVFFFAFSDFWYHHSNFWSIGCVLSVSITQFKYKKKGECAT